MKIYEQNFSLQCYFSTRTRRGLYCNRSKFTRLVTYGRDLKEAKKMAIDAIKGYIASLKKHKEPIPTDKETYFTFIEIKGVSVRA